MTITSTTRKAGPYAGNGSTTVFPFGYKVFAASEVLVVLADADGAETTGELGVTHTVTLNADQESAPGGSVAMSTAPASGWTLTLASRVSELQPVQLTNRGAFFPKVIEGALDRLTVLIQQVAERTDRALKTSVSTSAGVKTDLPAPVANRLLGWDAAGTALVNMDPAAVVTDNTEGMRVDLASTAPGKGSGLVAWIQSAIGAVARTVYDKLIERPLSPFDFMTPAQRADVRAAAYTLDVTAPMNACFAAAQAANRSVELPDGGYLVGNLLFGAQSTTAGSPAPTGLFGASKTGATLKAKPGLTGTLLQSWSVAGTTFRDFNIDTRGTAAQAWDCEWKPGTGPSTQNVIENITVNGGSAATHVNLKNLNDTFPVNLVVNATHSSQCCIDMTQPGGLAVINESIWNGGFLRFGCQNGEINGCWGMGIEYAQGCLNYVAVNGGYIYANEARDNLFWSQSFASFQSVRALVCKATQFITDNFAVNKYFDLNAYSMLKFDGCQWIGPTTQMFGPNCRKDGYARVRVEFKGGSIPGSLNPNEPADFDSDMDGLINDTTGQRVQKDRAGTWTPVVSGAATFGSATYSAQSGVHYRTGNTVRFELRVTWSGHTGTGGMRITGLPFTQLSSPGVGVDIGFATALGASSAYAVMQAGIISFYGATGAAISMAASGDLILSGAVQVVA